MKVAAQLGLLTVPPDNFTISLNYSTIAPDDSNSTSNSWNGSVVSGTSTYDFEYASRFQTFPTIEQAEPPPLLGPSVLLSTFSGPWSRILTSFIFICTLFLLALLCFSLALILMITFRRLWSYGMLSEHKRNKSMKDSGVSMKYAPPPTVIPPSWISPATVIPPHPVIPYPPPPPPSSKAPKSSAQFYPAKCKEITAIAKMAKVHAAESPDHIYMDIDSKSTTKETIVPIPPPRSVNKFSPPIVPHPPPSCFVTSVEDDAEASASVDEERMHANVNPVRFYTVSMPWFNQQQLIHQQIIQQHIRPSLNLSETNLRNAKASLKSNKLPLPQTLSMMDPHTGMMDCYSSYSEVVMELKNKFNRQLSKKFTADNV